jgi:AcrR family transcriptional regulator
MSESNAELAAATGTEPAPRRLGQRRQHIVAALRQCMIHSGYAETSLTDLARMAGMSVSHLLYYYASKELVLLDLADELNARVLADVTSYRHEPPEERIHVLVNNVFIRGAVTASEMSIVREIVALSIHRPELRERLNAFSKEMLAYLEDLFAQTPRQPGMSAFDTAEIASALWMGFFSNIEFDPQLSDGVARRLFRRMLLSLANLEAVAAPEAPTPGVPRKAAARRAPARKVKTSGQAGRDAAA